MYSKLLSLSCLVYMTVAATTNITNTTTTLAWSVPDCASGEIGAQVQFFPVPASTKFNLTESLTKKAVLAGNCTVGGRVNLEWSWLKRDGEQKRRRQLNMAISKHIFRDNNIGIALISVEYIHELKENMAEYIIGKRNINMTSSPSRAPLNLVVNLDTRYVYTKDNRTTDLPDSILKIEHLQLLGPNISRSGRKIATTAATAEASTTKNTAAYNVVYKMFISMLLILIHSFC